jgi:heme/copper-type cytochrome/quinol oxidase subunit 2
MKTLFIILKITFFLLAIPVMYFASHFSIGSQDDWNNAIENWFWEFYFSRLLFTLIAGAVFLLLSILLNWAFRKKIKYKRKMVLFEIAAIVIVAIIMTSIAVLK